MQLSEFDAALTAKDEEVARLKEQLACLDPHTRSRSHTPLTVTDLSGEEDMVPSVRHTRPQRGKAPPVDALVGKTLRYASMIGFLPCKGQLIGIVGTRINSLSS